MAKKNKKIKFQRQRYSVNEFDDSCLPTNRFKQFLDIIKIEWRTLFRIGFILLLFAIPFVIATFFRDFFISAYKSILTDSGASQEEIQSVINVITAIYLGVTAICFVIFSVGLAGVSRVIQNLVYGNGFVFRFDFAFGIKNNGKRFVITALILGIFNFLVQFNSLYFSQASSFIFQVIRFFAICLFFIFVLPIALFSMSNHVTYKMTVGECLSNGYKCTFARFLFTFIFSILFYGITFIEWIRHPVFIALAYVLLVILISPLLYLSWRLFAVSTFDKHINKDNYPEIYRKGLRPLLEQEREEK